MLHFSADIVISHSSISLVAQIATRLTDGENCCLKGRVVGVVKNDIVHNNNNNAHIFFTNDAIIDHHSCVVDTSLHAVCNK